MKYWLDTEFMEDGRSIELLSIGIVTEDGREFYAINKDAEIWKANEFVQTYVLPHLYDLPSGPDEAILTTGLYSYTQIKDAIISFIGEDESPEFWGYYASYDWVVFCFIFGKMIDLPKGWPMYIRDVKQVLDEIGNPRVPVVTDGHHNALSDARWTRQAWKFATDLKQKQIDLLREEIDILFGMIEQAEDFVSDMPVVFDDLLPGFWNKYEEFRERNKQP